MASYSTSIQYSRHNSPITDCLRRTRDGHIDHATRNTGNKGPSTHLYAYIFRTAVCIEHITSTTVTSNLCTLNCSFCFVIVTVMMLQLWRTSRKIGNDSVVLLSKLVQSPHSSRDILLREARESNEVATSYLRIEKEINLVRYYGIAGYLRERNLFQFHTYTWLQSQLPQSWRRGRLGPSSLSTFEPQQSRMMTTAGSSSSTMARVAFMITASQRSALVTKLGYNTEQIKQLTPLEATLILEHNIQPMEAESRLKTLVEEYNASLLAARQAATAVDAPPPEKEDSSDKDITNNQEPPDVPESQPEQEIEIKMLPLPAPPPALVALPEITALTNPSETTTSSMTNPTTRL